jgi:hypothetical protein
MTVSLSCIVVDAHDPAALAGFWQSLLGWPLETGTEDDGTVVHSLVRPGGPPLSMDFVPATEAKSGKNRLHLDLRPAAGSSQAIELQRLYDLGAKDADIGQGVQTWHVLTDPEGNEFCLLRNPDSE